jgi:hypothetical protein
LRFVSNPEVAGSNPASATDIFKHLQGIHAQAPSLFAKKLPQNPLKLLPANRSHHPENEYLAVCQKQSLLNRFRAKPVSRDHAEASRSLPQDIS